MAHRIRALPLFLLGPLLFALSFSAPAVSVRIVSYNIEWGLGEPGSAEYAAVSNVLARIDADIVALQEVTSDDLERIGAFAAGLGYPYYAVGGLGPFAGGLRNAILSRYPLARIAEVESPEDARELTRLTLYAEIFVPDAAIPLHTFALHLKSGYDDADEFRRAIEAERIRDAMRNWGITTSDATILLGDFNEDVADRQTEAFGSPPDGLPLSYTLGSDVTFPVPYAQFPPDAFVTDDLQTIDAPQSDGVTTWTRIPSERRLDYAMAGGPILDTAVAAETYNSVLDAVWPGLPKSGDPLAPETSAEASDHLPVFVDVRLPDLVVPVPRLVSMGFEDGALALFFVEPSGLPVDFRLQARPEIGSGVWVNLNATLEGPDESGRYRFLTTVPSSDRREYRILATPQ